MLASSFWVVLPSIVAVVAVILIIIVMRTDTQLGIPIGKDSQQIPRSPATQKVDCWVTGISRPLNARNFLNLVEPEDHAPSPATPAVKPGSYSRGMVLTMLIL